MIDKWSKQAFPVYDMQNFEFSKSVHAVHVKLENRPPHTPHSEVNRMEKPKKKKKKNERFERTKVFPHIFVTRNAITLYAIYLVIVLQ